MVGSAREGVWADDPDIRAFRQLVEDLQARGPPPAICATVRRSGHRFGARLTGAAYYRDRELWAQTPRPDVVAFRKLIEELRQRQERQTEERFVSRLRARLAEIASLSVADRRQAIGINDEYLALALAGGRVPAPIAKRLQLFLASG